MSKLKYEAGAIGVPTGPGLGVKLDRDKVAEYRELYLRLGSYPYDQDPLRPGWAPTIPNDRWADPADARVLEQLIYKWKHSRQEIAEALFASYRQLLNSGRAVTIEEISRDVNRLFSGNFHQWVGLWG